MPSFKMSIDADTGITYIVMEGAPLVDEATAFVLGEDFEKRTSKIVFDLRNFSTRKIASSDYVDSLKMVEPITRHGTRVAFVYSDSAEYGMGNMLKAHAQIAGYRAMVDIFKDLDEAVAWVQAGS